MLDTAPMIAWFKMSATLRWFWFCMLLLGWVVGWLVGHKCKSTRYFELNHRKKSVNACSSKLKKLSKLYCWLELQLTLTHVGLDTSRIILSTFVTTSFYINTSLALLSPGTLLV
jgi:hypothetical protein